MKWCPCYFCFGFKIISWYLWSDFKPEDLQFCHVLFVFPEHYGREQNNFISQFIRNVFKEERIMSKQFY